MRQHQQPASGVPGTPVASVNVDPYDPTQRALIDLPKDSDPLSLPGTGEVTEWGLSHYPKGTITYFALVTDPATMTPQQAYVIRLTDYHHVAQPFIELRDDCLLMGRYPDSQQPHRASIPLADVRAIFVATGWDYLPYTPPHPFYVLPTGQLAQDTSLAEETRCVRDREHLDCDLYVQVADESMHPLYAPGDYLLCNQTMIGELVPGKCYVFGLSPHEDGHYAVKRFDGLVGGALQISSVNPASDPARPLPGVEAYRVAVSELETVYQIAGVYTPEQP